jgi:hypothetical protein
MSGPEARIQKAIMQALAYDRDVLVLRINAGLQVLPGEHVIGGRARRRRVIRGAPAGTSDLLLCVRCNDPHGGESFGVFCALEVKAPRGRLTAKQAEFQTRVRELGGFACVVRSVEDAIAAVARCKEGKSE